MPPVDDRDPARGRHVMAGDADAVRKHQSKKLDADDLATYASGREPARRHTKHPDEILNRALEGSASALVSLQRLAGNTTTVALLGAPSGGIAVGAATDRAEAEADRAADAAIEHLRGGGAAAPPQTSGRSDDGPLTRSDTLARLTAPSVGPEGGQAPPDTSAAIESARGRGNALSNTVRSSMEGAFGADFGGVRVHTDAHADALSADLGARAFTTGSDIFFAHREYDPSSRAGQRVLAHELAHVVQQGGARRAAARLLRPIDPSIAKHASLTSVAENVVSYNAAEGKDAVSLLNRIENQLGPLIHELTTKLNKTRIGKGAVRARLQAARSLETDVRKERARLMEAELSRVQKIKSWVATNNGSERNVQPGKLAPGGQHALSKHLAEKAFDNKLSSSEHRGKTDKLKLSKEHHDMLSNWFETKEARSKAKYDAWLEKDAANRRKELEKPGKLAIDAEHRETLSDLFVTKSYDEDSLIDGEKRLGFIQNLTEAPGVNYGIQGRFGIRKKGGEVIVPVNVTFISNSSTNAPASSGDIAKVQKAIDKFWNVFDISFVKSKRKTPQDPATTTVKLKFVVGATTAPTRSVKQADGSTAEESPVLKSYEAASQGLSATAPASPQAGPVGLHSSKFAQEAKPGAKFPSTKRLDWAKGNDTTKLPNGKPGVRKWASTEGAEVSDPEVDAANLAKKFAVKAAHPVLLWSGDHPEWQTRGHHLGDDTQRKTRSDAANWWLDEPRFDEMAGHEFGHLIGLPDEYSRSHKAITKLTGQQPMKYDKSGDLEPESQKHYDAVVKALADARQNANKMKGVAAAFAATGAWDKISLLAAHHEKVTGATMRDELLKIQDEYRDAQEKIFQQWNVEKDAKLKARLSKRWSRAERHTKLVNKEVDAMWGPGWKDAFQRGFATGGLMGDFTTVYSKAPDTRANAAVHDHSHPLEPRHVRNFADLLGDARGEIWKAEHRK